jgi:enterochelin esterase-like enzyme
MRGLTFIFFTTAVALLLCVTNCGGNRGTTKPIPIPPQSSASSSSLSSAGVSSASGSIIRYETLYSAALKTEMAYAIYLPAGYDENQQYPVVYILYGYGGNERSMFNGFMAVNRTADTLIAGGDIEPVILVVPDYKNSFAVNSTREQNPNSSGGTIGSYEDYLIHELIPHIDLRFATRLDRAGRFIEGYSMGGFAALHLGFKHTHLFSKIGAHSAALWNYSDSDLFTGQRDWLFATPKLRALRDPFLLAQSANLNGLEIYLDVGLNDPLYYVNEAFYQLLVQQNAGVIWNTSAGGHDKNYWSANTAHYFRFFADQ